MRGPRDCSMSSPPAMGSVAGALHSEAAVAAASGPDMDSDLTLEPSEETTLPILPALPGFGGNGDELNQTCGPAVREAVREGAGDWDFCGIGLLERRRLMLQRGGLLLDWRTSGVTLRPTPRPCRGLLVALSTAGGGGRGLGQGIDRGRHGAGRGVKGLNTSGSTTHARLWSTLCMTDAIQILHGAQDENHCRTCSMHSIHSASSTYLHLLQTHRAQKYPAPVAGTVRTNVPTMYPWQGKMGENGGKWGKMGGNGGEMGENGGKWGKIRKLGWCNRSPFPPFPPHFLPIFPHFSQFPPIFPHFSSGAFPIFPHFSSGAFTDAPPPQPCCQPKP